MLDMAVRKRIGSFTIDLELSAGNELVCLLGPSGAGKSTLLQMIAGLIQPDEGRIRVKNITYVDKQAGYRRVTHLAPHKRRVGYVFQDYALFPHLNVCDNIVFGVNRLDKTVIRNAVDLIDMLRLKGLEHKRVNEISGGQQQRVALARALITKPDILLLDEPFSALDELIRRKIRIDLLRVHRETKIPILLVTHDLDEAYTLGDKIAVMDQGKIFQWGNREEIFRRPVNRKVARFVGMKNIFSGRVTDVDNEKKLIRVAGEKFAAYLPYFSCGVGEQVTFGIRPEDVRLIRDGEVLGQPVRDNLLRGRLVDMVPEGLGYRLFLQITSDNYDLEILVPYQVALNHRLNTGCEIIVSLKKSALHLIEKGGGQKAV